MKRYMNGAITYAALAMAGGVFYREFTKFNHFTGQTTLSVLHTHYFVLGMLFFLLLLLLDFSSVKSDKILLFYNIGLNITVAMLFARGITQVLNIPLSSGARCCYIRYSWPWTYYFRCKHYLYTI